jgi:ribosomal protein L11 methyltransferase
MDDMVHVLRIGASREFADIVQAMLETLDYSPTSWHEEDEDKAMVEVFCDTADQVESLKQQIEILLKELSPVNRWNIAIDSMPGNSWRDAWKEFFHTTRVSPRIVVKPSWEFYEAAAGDCVIEVDPGMSFGTGNHATTKGCLNFIDELSGEFPQRTFIDLGCGSGILSIAAAKLGLCDIVAIDNDEVSVEIACKNSIMNGVGNIIDFRVADLKDPGIVHDADIVCANILAHILVEYASIIESLVRPGNDSRLMLAGILTDEYGSVCKVFEDIGFRQIKSIEDDEWTSGLFGRG